MEKLYKTLAKIAKLFNQHDIGWSVGSSVLLSHFKLYDKPNDINIIVSKKSIIKAKGLLDKIGREIDSKESDVFLSDYYHIYNVDDIKIDLISGFKIKHESGLFELPEYKTASFINNEIHYASLEDWYVMYSLIPDGALKSKKIESYLIKMGTINKARLLELSNQELPEDTRNMIEKHLR